jgi:hypothetical protein
MRTEGVGKLKNVIHLIGYRTRDLHYNVPHSLLGRNTNPELSTTTYTVCHFPNDRRSCPKTLVALCLDA